MTKFIEIPASKISLAARKLVCGVGINDADYLTQVVTNGKRVTCPIYVTWSNMISRCYSESLQSKHPTYKGCTLFYKWLRFSAFRDWMIGRDWAGKDLDKDIIKTGNKIYGPDTCILVPPKINKLLISQISRKGDCSVGVRYNLCCNLYESRCWAGGKRVYIGVFETEKEASEAYLVFKSKHVLKIANEQDEPLKGYLIRISKEIASGEYFK